MPSSPEELRNDVHELLYAQHFEEALRVAPEAVRVAEEEYGKGHVDVAEAEALWAFACEATGRYDEAERLHLRALQTRRDVLGDVHPDVAESADGLAGLYETTGRYAEAEPLYAEALEVRRQAFGESHETYATALNNLAGIYVKTGRGEEAESLYLRAAEIDRVALGEDHPDYAIDLSNLSQLYRAWAEYSKAEPLARECAGIFEASLGSDHPMFATGLNNLAFVLWGMGRYSEAEPLYLQALSIQTQVLGEHPDLGTTLNNLGGLYTSMGRDAEAEPYYKRALKLYRDVLGHRHPTVATTLSNLAHLYRETGRYAEAEPLFLDSLDLTREVLGEEHPSYGSTLDNLGWLCDAMGRYDESERLREEALSVLRRALGDDHPTVAGVEDGLAGLYDATGRYEDAEQLFQRALSARQRVLGDEHPDVAASLNNLAGLYASTARYAEAEPLYLEAIRIRRQMLGDEHPTFAGSLNNLSAMYRQIGRIEEAMRLQETATAIRERAVGASHPDHATDLNNLAALYAEVGRTKEAETLYQKALTIRRSVVGDQHSTVASVLNNLAALYRDTDRFEDAEPLYLDAIERASAALGERHPTVATTLNNLADLYVFSGRYDEAEPILRDVVALRREALGERHPSCARSRVNLGLLLGATGRLAEALREMEKAIEIDDAMVSEIFGSSAEAHRMAYLSTLLGNFATYLSLVLRYAPEDPQAVRAALTLVLRRKGIGSEALSVQRDAIVRARRPELEPALEALQALRDRVVTATIRGPGPDGADAHRRRLETWADERNTLESELARALPEMHLGAHLREATPAAVADSLPAESALVEWVRFDVFDLEAVPARGEPAWQSARYLAFVLHASGESEPSLIDLGEADEIDQLIGAYWASIARAPEASGDPDRRALGETLRAAVLDPVRTALGCCTRLFVAPDGDLARLPFDALPLGDDHVIDTYEITYLTSGRDVLRFGMQAPTLPTLPVVAADPDFDIGRAPETSGVAAVAEEAGRNRWSHRSWRFDRLDGTRREGEQVAAALGVTPILGADVTKVRVKGVRSPLVLHLATHGFFLEDQEPLAATHEVRSGSDPLAPLLGLESPLLRSGLALAGANALGASETTGDGLLLAEDVTGLDLAGTELVVLSACETGLGEVRIGEGVYGLRRAFVIAGASTLVMSLWRVSDGATATLMTDFYARIRRGEPRSAALRGAQIALKATHPDPFYWAAFVCQGDPSALPGISPTG